MKHMIVEQLYTGCLSEAAYFIASEGEAAVIDPLRDTDEYIKKAEELGIDLQAVLDKTVTPTAEQLKLLADNQISAQYRVFAGFEIHNLFEFFMVFVILCGAASVVLFLLTPVLKKMMHGVK